MSTPRLLRRFYLKTKDRSNLLYASTFTDACHEVREDYANTGKRVILERRFTLLEVVEHEINTDYI